MATVGRVVLHRLDVRSTIISHTVDVASVGDAFLMKRNICDIVMAPARIDEELRIK